MKDKIQYTEYVSMTEIEYNKLLETYGLPGVLKAIEKLNNYKGAHGKKYKSDYLALLNWVFNSMGIKPLQLEIEGYSINDMPETEEELKVFKEKGLNGLREYRKVRKD